MELTKQDMLILLNGGGMLEKTVEGQVEPFEKIKVLEKVQYPRLVRILTGLIISRPGDTILKIGFSKDFFIEAYHFIKTEDDIPYYSTYDELYEFILHPELELFLSISGKLLPDTLPPSPIKFSITTFTLPKYILEAPSIKQVEIQNSFNIPNFLEEQK
ncbi:hypothetical protein [Persephonella sp.]